MWKWHRGKKPLTLKDKLVIAHVFDVPVSWWGEPLTVSVESVVGKQAPDLLPHLAEILRAQPQDRTSQQIAETWKRQLLEDALLAYGAIFPERMTREELRERIVQIANSRFVRTIPELQPGETTNKPPPESNYKPGKKDSSQP